MLFLIGLDVNIFWCKLALLNVSVQVTPAQHQIGLWRLLLLSSVVARHCAARGTTLGWGLWLRAYTRSCARRVSLWLATTRRGVPAHVRSSAAWPTFGSQFTLYAAREKHMIWIRWLLTTWQGWATLRQRAVVALDDKNFVLSRLDAPHPFTSLEKSSVKQCHVPIQASGSLLESKQKTKQTPQTPLNQTAKVHCLWLSCETGDPDKNIS